MTALPGCLVGQFELGLGPEIERARARHESPWRTLNDTGSASAEDGARWSAHCPGTRKTMEASDTAAAVGPHAGICAAHKSGPNTSYRIRFAGTPRSISEVRTWRINGNGPHVKTWTSSGSGTSLRSM